MRVCLSSQLFSHTSFGKSQNVFTDALFETLSLLDPVKTDVFDCGGGPVGLITAYMLARQGISTFLVGE